MKNQIVVVEGKNDIVRLKQVFPTLNVVSVNGSAINEDVVNMLIEKSETHEIIICTDPDYPGVKIRHELENKIKDVSHLFIERKIAFSRNRKKIGLEHLNNKQIIELFGNIIKASPKSDSDVDISFLHEYKLIGEANSKEVRTNLSNKLNLGHVNGKTLLNRIKSFNISKEDIINALKEVN